MLINFNFSYDEERNNAVESVNTANVRKRKKHGPLRYIGRFFLVFFTVILAVLIALVVAIVTIIHGPSETAEELFVTTLLETGQLKFVASMFLSQDEINEIVESASMESMETDIDTDLINVGDTSNSLEEEDHFDENGIEIIEISGNTYYAKLMVVQDPSNVTVGTTYPLNGGQWSEYGRDLDEIVEGNGAIAGVNGGLYESTGNMGGSPLGVVVSNGEIQYNDPSGWNGLYLIGFDEENILQIIDIEGMTQASLQELIETEGIRDAVAFQDEATDKNNHFVPLVINGVARELNGQGSGANPRTAIGQRADGAVLLLVTDGRGASGHLGATASDLINIMLNYGAVNAANLDGGSSSCMYYEGEYEMTSVTLYYQNASWRLPTAFLVKGG